MAEELLERHGIGKTAFHWSGQVKKVAYTQITSNDDAQTFSASLYLSLPLLPAIADVREAILHEIAHILTFLKYGPGAQLHGHEWKEVCKKIGANPVECGRKEELDLTKLEHKYLALCSGCDYCYSFNRLTAHWKEHLSPSEETAFLCPACQAEGEAIELTVIKTKTMENLKHVEKSG